MAESAGFGLYVHWPFCQAKCPYCDFNSHVVSSVDQQRWKTAFLSEIARVSNESSPRVLNSIFFGGGTPSLMPPDTVAAIIDAARAAWTPANDMEITLEANPTSVEAGKFRGFSDAGVNRVSIGVQSLRDPDLKALGRLHTAAEARAAFDIARETFPRVSFDLIYARQNQTLRDWQAELNEALSMAADHLSLYQLTIEPDTAFGERYARGRLAGLPEDDLSADMYNLTQDLTESAGLPAYETSNHAAAGAESKHNLIYWRSGDWAGIGPGAHGRLTIDGKRIETVGHRMPGKWLNAVEQDSSGDATRETINPEDNHVEAVMMGLRLGEGIPCDLLKDNPKLAGLIEQGFVEITDERIRTTRSGRPVLNAILRELLV